MISKIVIITVVILVLEFQYMVNKSWSKPADWYVLWSAFLILVSVLVAYPSYKWDVFGIIWWILSCLCCLFGSKIGEKYKIRYVKRKIGFKVGGLISYKNIVYIYFFMGILYSVILLASNGFSLFSIRKVSDLYAINNYMQAYRYSKMDINEGNIQQLCLAFTYALPICGGLLLTNGIGKKIL